MKQQYPVRHPPVPEAARRGETTPPGKPTLPHEADESTRSQASGGVHRAQGERALHDVTHATADTDRGPVLDQLYNEKVAPDRSAGAPRK